MAQKKKKRKNPAFYSFIIYRGEEDDDDEIRVEERTPGPLFTKRDNKVGLNHKDEDFTKYDHLDDNRNINNNQNVNNNQPLPVSAEDVIQCSTSNIQDIPDYYENIPVDDIIDYNNLDASAVEENFEDTPLSPEEYIDYASNENDYQDDYDQLVGFTGNVNSDYDNQNYNNQDYNNLVNNQPINNQPVNNQINEQFNQEIRQDSNAVPVYQPQTPIEPEPRRTRANYVNHAYGRYNFPPLNLLNTQKPNNQNNIDRAETQKKVIDRILLEIGLQAKVKEYQFGPTVIVYIIEFTSFKENPKRLLQYESTFMMHLKVKEIRILAPIPGQNYCGIEVPYENGKGQIVSLYDLLNSDEFKYSKYSLPVAVGRTNFNENIIIDIEEFPHGLCAGTTKSGKSVCLNVLLMSLIYKLTPDDVRLIIVDPKVMEFSKYADLPHLAMPVITDDQYFEPALEWLQEEMNRRKELNTRYDCVNLKELNQELVKQGLNKIPYIVFVMDEFNGWFCDASPQMRVNLGRILEQARACGIHIILATQRPSADVIEGKIKGNLETKFAFKVNSPADSNVILGGAGAESLVGHGDMILRSSGVKDLRLQGCFASQDEIKEVLKYVKKYNKTDYFVTLEELLQSSTQRKMAADAASAQQSTSGVNDSKFKEVCYYVVRNNKASGNTITQVFNVSWNRANSMLQAMAELGIVSSANTQGKAKEVLVNELELEEILAGI